MTGQWSSISRSVPLALLLASAPGLTRAQAPEVRADLQQLQAELSSIHDAKELRRLERRLNDAGATDSAEAVRRLRRGYVRLRLGRLGDGWSFGRAASDFGRATELAPGWTIAWYARGLARRAEGDWLAADALNLGKRVGLGSIKQAVRDFSRAVAADSTNAAAGRQLFDSALLLRDTAELALTALPGLRQVMAAGAADTAVLLALCRAERLMGDPHAALEAARRYLNNGGTRGLGLRELAWSSFVAEEPGGDSAYYAGAFEDDAVSITAYRNDLALIAGETTLAAFDRSRGGARAELLRRFWTDRDRQSLRSDGERLREHYRRLHYAERHLGLEVNRRYYAMGWTDMYRSGSTRFDDRGIIYLRYGPPDQRAATVTFDIMPNETWRYHRANGDLLLHFAANHGGDIRDYRLVPSITSIEGVSSGGADNAATYFAFQDRCPLYPPFCKLLNWGPLGRARALSDERTLVETSVALAVSTDGFERHFDRELDAKAMAFAVGRDGGGQLVHVAFQVMLGRDDPSAGIRDHRPFRVRVNLVDTAGHSGGWVDTAAVLSLPGGDLHDHSFAAVGRVTLVVPAGRWRYQAALSDGDSVGRVLPSDSLVVGNFDGTRLTISDLVLSKDGRGAPWVPAERDTAYFSPRDTWAKGDTISLYHEVYGLKTGSFYKAKLLVRKGQRTALTLRWEGVASDAVTRLSRTLTFATVRPGDYELEVEVTDAGGRTARSARRITITH